MVECPGYVISGSNKYGQACKTYAGNLATAMGLALISVTTDSSSVYNATYAIPGATNMKVNIYNSSGLIHIKFMLGSSQLADKSFYSSQYATVYSEVIASGQMLAFKEKYGAANINTIAIFPLKSKLDNSTILCATNGLSSSNLTLYSDSSASTTTADLNFAANAMSSKDVNMLAANEWIAIDGYVFAASSNNADAASPYYYPLGLYTVNALSASPGLIYTDGTYSFLVLLSGYAIGI